MICEVGNESKARADSHTHGMDLHPTEVWVMSSLKAIKVAPLQDRATLIEAFDTTIK